MILDIVKYGHPALRQKGRPVERLTPALQSLIDDLLDTMYAAAGVGLAAQQVGVPAQIAVIDVRAATDRPSTLSVEGVPEALDAWMPLVLINPEVTPLGGLVTGPEGCLSFPEIYAEIARPEAVQVRAMNRSGDQVVFQCGGLLARAVQHETDHLHGILFIDRMSAAVRQELRADLEELHQTTQRATQKFGTAPGPG